MVVPAMIGGFGGLRGVDRSTDTALGQAFGGFTPRPSYNPNMNKACHAVTRGLFGCLHAGLFGFVKDKQNHSDD